MVVGSVLGLGEPRDEAADLAGGELDQLAGAVRSLRRPEELSTAAGAPFELR